MPTYATIWKFLLTTYHQRRMIMAQTEYANSVSGSKLLSYLSFAESGDIFICGRFYENSDFGRWWFLP